MSPQKAISEVAAKEVKPLPCFFPQILRYWKQDSEQRIHLAAIVVIIVRYAHLTCMLTLNWRRVVKKSLSGARVRIVKV